MPLSKALCTSLALLAVSVSFAQGAPETRDRIIELGKGENQASQMLRELTANIGARRTGSQALHKAQVWAMEKLKKFGWKNVRLEQWGEVPVGFERGTNYSGGIVAPFPYTFPFSSAAWTAGTQGPLRAPAVMQPESMEEFNRVKDQLKGKWVIMQGLVGMRSSRRPDKPTEAERTKDPKAAELIDLDYALDTVGIAGRVYGEGDKRNLVHTHGRFTDLDPKNLPTDVRVNIGYSNYQMIKKMLDKGEPVELSFNVDQRFVPGKVPQYNVVAEWPGTDKADEIVLFGGHLDSWDGPGSQGANDNGTGSCVGLEAARLIAKSGAKPRRTIRLTLWSGEEQGLLGSVVQAKQSKDKGEKIDVAFIEDSGSSFHGALYAVPQWKDILEQAVADTSRAFPEHPIKVNVMTDGKWPRGGGSDHASYLGLGIPGLFWGKAGPQDYGHVWHTQYDRFEEAIPEAMVQMSTNMALTVYNVACADQMLWRPDTLPTSFAKLPDVHGFASGHQGCTHGEWLFNRQPMASKVRMLLR
ncbi:MAG: M20/M25/M40 family metallo-hydrolase [Armatimonadetes bacterium]|nr:M20/M25/M40 family metallo-hydrolase [Armatimonadota bacterium]